MIRLPSTTKVDSTKGPTPIPPPKHPPLNKLIAAALAMTIPGIVPLPVRSNHVAIIKNTPAKPIDINSPTDNFSCSSPIAMNFVV